MRRCIKKTAAHARRQTPNNVYRQRGERKRLVKYFEDKKRRKVAQDTPRATS